MIHGTAKKIKFSHKNFFIKCEQPAFAADFFIFTKEIYTGRLRYLCDK